MSASQARQTISAMCSSAVAPSPSAVADDARSPADRLVAAVRAIVDVMYDRQDLTLLFYREAHSLDRELHLAIRARLRECREPSWLENIELRAKKAIKCENIDQKYSHI